MLDTTINAGQPGHVDAHKKLHGRYNAETWVYSGDGEAVLRAALAAGGIVHLAGTYTATTPLDMADACHILCAPLTTIRAAAEMDYVLGMRLAGAYGGQHWNIRNLVIDANSLATNGLRVCKASMSHFTAIDGLQVQNAVGDGIVMQACQGGIFQSLRADSCGGRGIVLQGCNAARLYGASAVGNTGDGIVVERWVDGAATYTGGCYLFGVHSESNDGHGIVIASSPTPSVVIGGWLENLGGDGVRIAGYVPLVQGILIGAGRNQETTYAVHLVNGAKGGTVRDCSFGGTGNFAHVAVEPEAAGEWTLVPNYGLNSNCAMVEPLYLRFA